MKTRTILIPLAASLFSLTASAAHTRVTNPNALSVELLGRGMLYGIQYDRVLNDDMAAGFGFGTVGTQTLGGSDTGQSGTMIPVFFNYYFTRDQGSIFGTLGATVVANGGTVKGFKSSVGAVELPDSGVLPNVGVGYENRGDTGFLVRFAGYVMAGKKVVPWAGATFGYAF